MSASDRNELVADWRRSGGVGGALTVHRAQGSEYDEVGFIPGPAASRVNTRELLYTAITRARDKVTIHSDAPVSAATIRAAIARKTERASGLLDRLAVPRQQA